MTKELVTIDGREYLVAPNGAICDDDGNVCGFLGADVVGGEENFADSFLESYLQDVGEEGAKGRPFGPRSTLVIPELIAAVPVAAVTGAMGYAVGKAAKEYYDASAEADRAEKIARNMERRLNERRQRR